MASGEVIMAGGVEIGVAAVEDRAVDVEGEGDRGSTVWWMVTNNAR